MTPEPQNPSFPFASAFKCQCRCAA